MEMAARCGLSRWAASTEKERGWRGRAECTYYCCCVGGLIRPAPVMSMVVRCHASHSPAASMFDTPLSKYLYTACSLVRDHERARSDAAVAIRGEKPRDSSCREQRKKHRTTALYRTKINYETMTERSPKVCLSLRKKSNECRLFHACSWWEASRQATPLVLSPTRATSRTMRRSSQNQLTRRSQKPPTWPQSVASSHANLGIDRTTSMRFTK